MQIRRKKRRALPRLYAECTHPSCRCRRVALTLRRDLRIPIDSLVVLPGLVSNSVAGVWSEACAEAITDGLAESGRLRVIRSRRAGGLFSAEISPRGGGKEAN